MKLSLGNGEGNSLRVWVVGKVTQHDFGPIQEPLETLVGPGVYSRQITLDMADTSYMDSSGVGWLLTCHKRCREAGGQITLCNVTPVIGTHVGPNGLGFAAGGQALSSRPITHK